MTVLQLAVMLAGGAFLPLGLDQSADRLEHLTRMAQVCLLVLTPVPLWGQH